LEFENGELSKFEVLKNEYIEREKRKGLLISDWLSSKNIDKVYTRTKLKKGPRLVFENSFIDTIQTDHTQLKEIVNDEKAI
jgi:predicted Fe-Mo cluster-binding NifX family protein